MTDRDHERVELAGIHDRLTWRHHWRRLRALCWGDLLSLITDTLMSWYAHNVPRLGASLAFYTLLSLAPLIIIVIAVAGAVFGREAATGQLVWQIEDLIGRAGAETVQTLLQGAQMPSGRAIASILGVLTLVYAATSVVAELRDALNTIWCVPKKEEPPLRSLLSVLVDRTVALATVLGVGFLLLVSLAVNAAISAVGKRYQWWLPTSEYLLQTVDFVITYGIIALLFAVMYKMLPDLDIRWSDVFPGALLTSLLFSLGKTLIGLYLGKAGIGSTYGAAGSLVVVLVWVYYSGQIFYLGAEFTQVYAQRYGSAPCDRLAKQLKLQTPEPQPVATPDADAPKEPLVRLS